MYYFFDALLYALIFSVQFTVKIQLYSSFAIVVKVCTSFYYSYIQLSQNNNNFFNYTLMFSLINKDIYNTAQKSICIETFIIIVINFRMLNFYNTFPRKKWGNTSNAFFHHELQLKFNNNSLVAITGKFEHLFIKLTHDCYKTTIIFLITR